MKLIPPCFCRNSNLLTYLHVNKGYDMNTATGARLSTEPAQVSHNDSGVQYESKPKTRSIDAVLETEPTIKSANISSLQTVQESVLETSSQAKASPRHSLNLWLKKLFGVQRIPETGCVGQPTKLQRNKVIDDSDSVHSKNIDTLKAMEREAELQRIERFKVSGM